MKAKAMPSKGQESLETDYLKGKGDGNQDVKKGTWKPTEELKSKYLKRHKYKKAKDNRGHGIRWLFIRNGAYYARLTVETDGGKSKQAYVPLAANTTPEAQEELRKLLVERSQNTLRHIGESPKFADYYNKTYLPMLESSAKKPDTKITEKTHCKRWLKALGALRLDKIRPNHIQTVIQEILADHAPRTCNIALVCLRSILKAAKRDGFLKALPTEDIEWQPVDTKSKEKYTVAEIEQICDAALATSKNGQQFSDYIHFLLYCGAREQESLKIRWGDVDFTNKLLTVGADGDTKNREARRVDFNSSLEAHLLDMQKRRAPDSDWLFPSPQRGEKDKRALTFRETMKIARSTPEFVCQDCQQSSFKPIIKCTKCGSAEIRQQQASDKRKAFGFHQTRHRFISNAVEGGIDFMTIAKWVGHKDGGVLIGKVYGDVANQHRQRMAGKLVFGPVIVECEKEA